MGYCDDFYLARNIIGYTGLIDHQPTVYFKNAQYHGRITQFHRREYLVGRFYLYTNEGHQLLNYSPDLENHDLLAPQLPSNTRERGNMFEIQFGRCCHVSRNPFTPIPPLDTSFRSRLPSCFGGGMPEPTPEREILAKSIIEFQDISYKSLNELLNLYSNLQQRNTLQEKAAHLRPLGYKEVQDMKRHITLIKEDRSIRHPEEAGIKSIEEWSAFILSKCTTPDH
ncbi:hypothetical protein NX722_15805 [Endozoicomonas gorgoniicola]|uniref:Uncharacterized protein n=1 Tax=Endozoicomonas gorgoniicola TaxID=1234144 RepID=A0ABT3MXF0_9GAMM|nr:hypothetical protein [Endozoicomonas gorgoniicola]MCW7554055.1 hypothetical protein [Endozoicomonas gorgoniicola]